MRNCVLVTVIMMFIAIGMNSCIRSSGWGRNIGIIGGADGPTSIFVSPKENKSIENKSSENKPNEKINAIERIVSTSDKDGDGLNDTDDIIEGARKDVQNKSRYTDGYYSGGYPPDGVGVCTDVIWRAFRNAGYTLKDMVDEDIKNNAELYPRVAGNPDPNIDFRRIKNLRVFFDRYAIVLTTEIIPGDIENLKEWQPGDIIVFDDPLEHIAILSDQRNEYGVPLIIHNSGPHAQENDMLIYWHENLSSIVGHYRFPPEEIDGSAEKGE